MDPEEDYSADTEYYYSPLFGNDSEYSPPNDTYSNDYCPKPIPETYPSVLGFDLAVPEWEAIVTAITLTLIIILTIVGNILVILSVFTHKPLRIVQNFFIVSLAVADLTVAILVLPFNVAYSVLGRWVFGIHVCKMWLTCDVLCCTASILNLCAIALDRYWAITDPINYAQKRTLKRVLVMIGGVWLLSGIISSPPLIGWNNWPDEFETTTPCELTTQQGYVIYSSLGSFYIPLFIMTIVYIEIYIATRRRLRERARASKLNTVKQSIVTQVPDKDTEHNERESVSSETNHNDPHGCSEKTELKKNKKKKKKKKRKSSETSTGGNQLAAGPVNDDSVTDNDAGQRRDSATVNHCDDNQSVMTTTTSPGPKTPSVHHPPPQPQPKPVQVHQFIEEKQRISLSKERRAARTLGIIMGVFVVCWLPFFLMYVILPFCLTCCPSGKLINFITWLGYINSALNPIIYTIFNLDFRRAFKKLLHMRM